MLSPVRSCMQSAMQECFVAVRVNAAAAHHVMLQDCVNFMHKVHLHDLLDSSLGKAL